VIQPPCCLWLVSVMPRQLPTWVMAAAPDRMLATLSPRPLTVGLGFANGFCRLRGAGIPTCLWTPSSMTTAWSGRYRSQRRINPARPLCPGLGRLSDSACQGSGPLTNCKSDDLWPLRWPRRSTISQRQISRRPAKPPQVTYVARQTVGHHEPSRPAPRPGR
jgi:hypothetical protein